jgi:hypothetical protein
MFCLPRSCSVCPDSLSTEPALPRLPHPGFGSASPNSSPPKRLKNASRGKNQPHTPVSSLPQCHQLPRKRSRTGPLLHPRAGTPKSAPTPSCSSPPIPPRRSRETATSLTRAAATGTTPPKHSGKSDSVDPGPRPAHSPVHVLPNPGRWLPTRRGRVRSTTPARPQAHDGPPEPAVPAEG